MYVIDVDAVSANDGRAYRDVIPVRVFTTPTAFINGQWRDVIPVDAVTAWNVQDGQGKWHSATPIKVYDADTALINGVRRTVIPVRVVSGSIGFYVGAQVAFEFTKSKYRVGGWRRNLCPWSADASRADWLANLGAKLSGQADPFGGTGAAIFTADGTAGQHFFQSGALGVQFVAGTTYTVSIYLKAGSTALAQLALPSTPFPANPYANFQLTGAGSVIGSGGGATATIVSLGNGWYRASMTVAATVTAASPALDVAFISAGTDGRIPPNTSAGSLYGYGAQAEPAPAMTALIVTGATGVTVYDDPNAGSYGSLFTTAAIPSLSIARASVGYVEDQADDGSVTLRLVPANTARIGRLKGLLIEEQRTNMLLWSQAMGTAPWTNGATGAAANNQALSPDGTFTASQLDFSADASTSDVYQSVATVIGQAYTMTVWLRSPAAANIQFFAADGGGTTITASAPALTNQWQRFTVSGVATSTSMRFRLRVGAAQNGKPVYAWGAQVELGAFPTSYIPTTTAAATRAADVATLTWSPPNDWALVASVLRPELLTGTGVARRIIGSDGTGAVGPLTFNASNNLTSWNGSVELKATPAGPATPGSVYTGAVAWTTGRRAMSALGGPVATDANGPGAWSYLSLGQSAAGANPTNTLNSYISKVLIYPRAFNDAELQTASAAA